MGIVAEAKRIKEVHPDFIMLYKSGSFYKTFGKDAYIVNGKIICRKMAKKNVVFPTYFLYHGFMI